MSEDEAREWLASTFGVSRGTVATLERLAEIVADENGRQNLVSPSTLPTIWSRHIADSAQLLLHARSEGGDWIDIGTGAGFPGVVVAVLSERHVMLVESRKLRASFLLHVIAVLGLKNIEVAATKVEALRRPPAHIISARAVAPLEALFTAAYHLSGESTAWVLPKGRRAGSELAAARDTWQGDFAMKPSVTDPEATIIVATNISRRDA